MVRLQHAQCIRTMFIEILFKGIHRWLQIPNKHHLVFEWILMTGQIGLYHDVIKWKDFPRYWPFVRGIHRSPVNSPHKGQWRRALMVSLICVWTNGWVNNRDAGDLRRHRANFDVTVIVLLPQASMGWPFNILVGLIKKKSCKLGVIDVVTVVRLEFKNKSTDGPVTVAIIYVECVFGKRACKYGEKSLCHFRMGGGHSWDLDGDLPYLLSIRRTQSQNLDVYCLVLQLPLPNALKSGVKLRTKM